MNVKKLIAVFAIALVVGSTTAVAAGHGLVDLALDADEIRATGDETEQLVEGHTVYAEIVNRNASDEQAAAVAVYVENRTRAVENVLWFDDSFLHKVEQNKRAPACGGTVWAMPSGVPFPGPNALETLGAAETYKIDDPNGKSWLVNAYGVGIDADGDGVDDADLGIAAWSVEVDCPALGTPYQTSDLQSDDFLAPDVGVLDYNAVLWFFMDDVDKVINKGAPAVHGVNVTDVDGDGDNDADTPQPTTQGNSHPYNPADTNPAELHTHRTAYIDLYYESFDDIAELTPTFDNNEDFGCWHDHDGDGCL